MQYLKYEQRGPIVFLRLNRPERMNAYGTQMKLDFREAWPRFENDPEARVLVLTGEGRAFCAGRDIKEQAAGLLDRSLTPRYFVPRMDKPVIAAVHGVAVGVGFGLTLGSDLRVASEDAEFGMPELPTGLMGPADLSLTQCIPWAVANEIVLLGRRITAQRAYEVGLINRVVPRDQLGDAALDYAEALAALPPIQLGLTLRMLRKVQPQLSEELYEERQRLHAYQMSLGDTSEAARAFVERRDARFTGAGTVDRSAE